MLCIVLSHSVLSVSATLWILSHQVPLSMGFFGTGVGGHFLLQQIFLTQVSNLFLPCLLHWHTDYFTTEPPGKPWWQVFCFHGSLASLEGLQSLTPFLRYHWNTICDSSIIPKIVGKKIIIKLNNNNNFKLSQSVICPLHNKNWNIRIKVQ